MAIVCYFKKPTFFITFTANLRWLEIVNNLFLSQQSTDQPDLIACVFCLKVKKLLMDLKKGLFGLYQAYVYTIEY
jgi:hypothetical protein